ncbi:MAG: hypothetical protein LBC85_10090 [Fibromonadaceae bacterium]|jgi:hypothetical protein|nr:hypothetical protein [Fibromonadaceae bacterium]
MKIFLALLFLVLAAHAQQERIAIINTVDSNDSISVSDLNFLTDRLRGIAVDILPQQRYGIMTQESIVAFLGSQERAAKECQEASCLADLGRRINADYIAQGRIGRFGRNLTIKVELYSSKSANLLGSFDGYSEDLYDLLYIINAKTPEMFRRLSDGTVDNTPEAVPLVPERRTVTAHEPTPAPTPKIIPTNEHGAFYFSVFKPSITSEYNRKNQKIKREGLSVMGGLEIMDDISQFGGGLFIGGGSLGDDIGEFILGLSIKRLHWVFKNWVALPVSLDFAWRAQFMNIENFLVAEFMSIIEPKFLTESAEYLNRDRSITKHNFDIMPAIDLQFFIDKHFSLYGGYMYRLALSGDWGFFYKIPGRNYEQHSSGSYFKVPSEYDPLLNAKERVFGIPGTLRFGMKIHFI